MKVALHILGYNDVFHNLNTFQNLREWDIWIELAQAKLSGDPSTINWRKEFDGLLGHCEAVTDTPPSYFGSELIAAYPDAKVILVQRDFDAWERSFLPLLDVMWNPVYNLLTLLDPQCLNRITKISNMIAKSKHVTSKEETKAKLQESYYTHYDTIRAATSPERLLNYELGSGWEPLCEFLGKPIPNEPFPHINESAALKDWIVIITRRSLFNALRNSVLVGTVVSAVVVGLFWKFK
jgi:hypothetical protein